MNESDHQEVEVRRIADYIGRYAGTIRQLTARFSDRSAIFPPELISISGANIYSCRDAVVLDLTEGTHSPQLVYQHLPEKSGSEIFTALTLGMFQPESKTIPAEATGSPFYRVSNLTLETPSAKRPVVDLQVWTRPDADRLTPQLAEQLALQDVQSRLLAHALGWTGELSPNAIDTFAAALNEFEKLVADENALESVFQDFLSRNPMLLVPGFEQVIPKQQLGVGRQFEVDFVVKHEASRYTVVEIERLSTPILTRQGDFAAPFNHAERQVIDFLNWIDQNLHTARTVLPDIHNPKGLVVVGRRSALDAEGLMRLEAKNASTRGRYEFLTFDDLLERGRFLLRELTR
jgi:antiviral defense system Shedu protein SduA